MSTTIVLADDECALIVNADGTIKQSLMGHEGDEAQEVTSGFEAVALCMFLLHEDFADLREQIKVRTGLVDEETHSDPA